MTGPQHDPDHWADHSPYDDQPHPDDTCGHRGPRGTACTEPDGHTGSHGDGTVYRWVVRQ